MFFRFAGRKIDDRALLVAINRDRQQFIYSMSHTIIDDVAERLAWRFESITAAEVVAMMKLRERNSYDDGFANGVSVQKRRNIRAICSFPKIKRLRNQISRISRQLLLIRQHIKRGTPPSKP